MKEKNIIAAAAARWNLKCLFFIFYTPPTWVDGSKMYLRPESVVCGLPKYWHKSNYKLKQHFHNKKIRPKSKDSINQHVREGLSLYLLQKIFRFHDNKIFNVCDETIFCCFIVAILMSVRQTCYHFKLNI